MAITDDMRTNYRPSRPYNDRKKQPAMSLYFVRDKNNMPAHKLSCMYCKRTIMDGVKGVVDKAVDGPISAEEHDMAFNIQCSLCGQKYRLLVGGKLAELEEWAQAPPPREAELETMQQ